MNFTQLKQDLDEMREEREAYLREAYETWQRTERELAYATPAEDMRLWSQIERAMYETACDAAWQAWRAYEAARKAL
jgi:hypothetical protein